MPLASIRICRGAGALESSSPRVRTLGMAFRLLLRSNPGPSKIGADYLMARTGRGREREAALTLSEALGGVPLAHEQAAAYCERLRISLAEYHERYQVAPAAFLDDPSHASAADHIALTVAKTFALAVEAAGRLHPAAEPLSLHAALLAPEPIPLFLLEKLGGSKLAGGHLEAAVKALNVFGLVRRERIADKPSIGTDAIRLHQLVHAAAAAWRPGEWRNAARRALINAIAAVYPRGLPKYSDTWLRARCLDALAVALVVDNAALTEWAEASTADLLDALAQYTHTMLEAHPQAKALYERALAIREKVLGPEHPDTAKSLGALAVLLLFDQGDRGGARPLFERALAISTRRCSAPSIPRR
jgi:tetratricopeptide (TPR) repeat protein